MTCTKLTFTLQNNSEKIPGKKLLGYKLVIRVFFLLSYPSIYCKPFMFFVCFTFKIEQLHSLDKVQTFTMRTLTQTDMTEIP